MSKKTRKKSLAKPSKTPARKSPKRPLKATRKTSKSVSAKKSPAKTAGKSKTPATGKVAKKAVKAGSTASPKPVAASKTPPVAPQPVRSKRPAGPLAEGQPAPGFDLPRDGGGRLSLRDFAGRKLVLFFYPRADTPGCTKEAMDFSRLAKEFATSGTAVVGISADSLKAQESFRDKHELKTPLLSDEHKETLKAYSVWGEKSMYGRVFEGILRTTVLIGEEGEILRVWRNVKVDGHADDVLAAVRSL
jgi:peroxiredoxin Q/BCP